MVARAPNVCYASRIFSLGFGGRAQREATRIEARGGVKLGAMSARVQWLLRVEKRTNKRVKDSVDAKIEVQVII